MVVRGVGLLHTAIRLSNPSGLNEHRSAIRVYQNKTEKERLDHLKTKSEHKYGETSVARHFMEAGHRVSELR